MIDLATFRCKRECERKKERARDLQCVLKLSSSGRNAISWIITRGKYPFTRLGGERIEGEMAERHFSGGGLKFKARIVRSGRTRES